MLRNKERRRRRHAVVERDVDGGTGVFLRVFLPLHRLLLPFFRRSFLDSRFCHRPLRCQGKT